MQHGIVLGMMRPLLLQSLQRSFERKPLSDSQSELALILHLLQCKKVLPIGVVLRRSDSPLRRICQGEFHGTPVLLSSRFGNYFVKVVFGPLADNPRKLAVCISICLAARYVIRTFGHTRYLECRRVSHGDVTIDAAEKCWVALSNRVEILACRQLL